MASFTHLRSDYPLVLTLLGPAYSHDLTGSYIARSISPRAILVPVIRLKHPAPVSISTTFRSSFCPSSCARSASEGTWGLIPAPALLREIQLHADKQSMSPADNHRANLCGRIEFDSRESDNFFVGEIVGICGCRSHMLLCDFHRRNSTKGPYDGCAGTRWRACSRIVWASQIKSGGAHHVSKQRSRKF
jgi:hypothetical protein